MKKYTVETLVGVFMLIGLVCIGYLTVKLGKMEWFGSNDYPVIAQFQSVSGLKTGASVEIAGVQVGKVESISLNQDFGVAKVKMMIQKDIQLSEDSIASVKTSGLIGDKYIMITLGGAEEKLQAGERISETESAVDLESLISQYVFGDI